jgi:hypothetical protein
MCMLVVVTVESQRLLEKYLIPQSPWDPRVTEHAYGQTAQTQGMPGYYVRVGEF